MENNVYILFFVHGCNGIMFILYCFSVICDVMQFVTSCNLWRHGNLCHYVKHSQKERATFNRIWLLVIHWKNVQNSWKKTA